MNPNLVRSWFEATIASIDPERLTADALSGRSGSLTLIAIGKAAPAMCRGAARAVGEVRGVCVTDHVEHVPEGMELMLGDHPLPGSRSVEAGERVLALAVEADIALISGGGSALCETPINGVDIGFVATVTGALLRGGADIEEMNLVRGHLSRVKNGGLGPIPTYILSDVGKWGPAVVSSGPTVPGPARPERAISIIRRYGVEVPEHIAEAILARPDTTLMPPVIEVLADGRTAAAAMARAAGESGIAARVSEDWLFGSVESCLDRFVSGTGPGVTVAAGEPGVTVRGDGRGGRNTHAALLAAEMLSGSEALFAAFATDGVDGNSGSAGAIVDGTTLARGGDPTTSLRRSDSATYLDRIDGLVRTGPTGTNVADLWVMWKPDGPTQPILAT